MFSDVIAHMVEGIMFHSQMADYFGFLGLEGFRREQEEHYRSESESYRRICDYFVDHYDRLPDEVPFDNPKVIPESWWKYTRHDVDDGTKLKAIREAFRLWEDWEKESKEIYEKESADLLSSGRIAGAIAIDQLVKDVDKELCHVEHERLNVNSLDLPDVINLQRQMVEKYDKLRRDRERDSIA